MKEQSRRQFINSCLYWTISGFCFPFISFCAGCKKEKKSTSQPGFLDHEKKERPVVEGTAKINPDFEPAYLRLHRSGELKKRGEELWSMMKSCELCPRRCGVNRLDVEEGFCQASFQLEISSYHPHFGEEKSLIGKGGSGTIFFTSIYPDASLCAQRVVSGSRKCVVQRIT